MQVQPVLFNTRDTPIHTRKRKYIAPAFAPKNLRDFEQYMDPNIQALVEVFQETAAKKGTLDWCVWSNYLAFDIIGDYAFGTPFGFLASRKDDYNLINTVNKRGEVLNALGHLPLWMRPYMKHFRLDPFWFSGMQATASLESIGRAAFAARGDGERSDLMSFLLAAKDPDTGGPLPSEEVIAEAISFIVGGSDTTSSTMANCMDYISRDQKLQQAIFDELLEAFPGPLDDNWVAPETETGKLPFLNAAIKEVMRLRSTSSTGLERVVPPGGSTIAGKFFPENSLVSIPTYAIHHNPELFPVCTHIFPAKMKILTPPRTQMSYILSAG